MKTYNLKQKGKFYDVMRMVTDWLNQNIDQLWQNQLEAWRNDITRKEDIPICQEHLSI